MFCHCLLLILNLLFVTHCFNDAFTQFKPGKQYNCLRCFSSKFCLLYSLIIEYLLGFSNLHIFAYIVGLGKNFTFHEILRTVVVYPKRKKYTLSPRYWYTSIGQYWTNFMFQYCKLLNNTSMF